MGEGNDLLVDRNIAPPLNQINKLFHIERFESLDRAIKVEKNSNYNH